MVVNITKKGIFYASFDGEKRIGRLYTYPFQPYLAYKSIPVHRWEAIEDSNGEWLAWYDETKQRMIFVDHPTILQMYFPYPLSLYEKNGEGRRVPVRLEHLDEQTKPGDLEWK